MGLRRVLVTRPEPDSRLTAARLEAAGYRALRDPLLIIDALPDAVLPAGPFDALALTSVNGARALAARPELSGLLSLPLYAVGRRTAAVAPSGFAALKVAGGDGAALVRLLEEELRPGARLLHVCGEERAVDLGEALAGHGVAAELFVVYRARAASCLAASTITALREGQVDAAFHFSPRTAATMVALTQAAGLAELCATFEHLCFSQNVAAPLRDAGWPTRIAAGPTEDALFALLAA